jgi:hypothetical protein
MTSLVKITDEDQLWELIRPNLRGKWYRLETVVPDGLTDTFGLWADKTWWLELKIGKPKTNKLRPKQIEFGYECQRHGIPFYVCFGYMKKPRFYRDFNFGTEVTPPFYRTPTVV